MSFASADTRREGMRVIAVVNMKGGVGKTTVSVALAETLSAVAGMRTLLIDLDPQASCTFAVLGESRFDEMRLEGRHVARLFEQLDPATGHPMPMNRVIWPDASMVRRQADLGLISSLPELQRLERDVVYALARSGVPRSEIETRAADHLGDCLREVAGSYDVAVIDCPPGVSAFTEAAVRIADAVISPVVLEYLPVLGLEAFVLQTIQRLRKEALFRGRNFVLFNQLNGGREEARFAELCLSLSYDLGDDMAVLETRLPRTRDVANLVSPPEHPTTFKRKYGEAGPLFHDLAYEVMERVGAPV